VLIRFCTLQPRSFTGKTQNFDDVLTIEFDIVRLYVSMNSVASVNIGNTRSDLIQNLDVIVNWIRRGRVVYDARPRNELLDQTEVGFRGRIDDVIKLRNDCCRSR